MCEGISSNPRILKVLFQIGNYASKVTIRVQGLRRDRSSNFPIM